MNNIFAFTPKLKTISKIVAIFVIVSVLIPSAILSSPSTVSAEESAVSSSESSDSSTPSDSPSDSGDTSPSEGSSTGPSTTEGGDASANTPQTVPQKPADAPEDATTNTGGNSDVVADVANESSGGGSRSAELTQSPAGATGSITFCTMIADINDNVKTDAVGLHPGSFHIELIDATSTETRRILGESTMNVIQSPFFSPNRKILPTSSTNDADCTTFSDLPLGVDYYYTTQTITGGAVNAWQTPKYNDQYERVVNSLNDFYPYSPELFDDIPGNDEDRNLDADGYFIPLTPERSSRTLVILNRYTPGNQAPILTLNGSNPTTVVIGNGYHEAHAIATDDWDVVNDWIQMTGVVDDQTVGRYELVYTVTDGGDHNVPPSQRVGLSDTETRVVNVVARDSSVNQAPVLTLLGDNPMTIVVGGTFTEPGWTAIDPDGNPDGSPRDISNIVRPPRETVNTNVIGSYDLTYTVTDGHSPVPASDQKVRRVNVVAAPDNGNGGGGGGGGSSGGRSRRNNNNNNGNNNNNEGQVLGVTTGPQEACTYLNDYMKKDWANNSFEVIKLQSFLKYFEGFTDLQPTGVFDQATHDAVSAFQKRYAGDVLAPWGYDSNNSTGFVYILTKKKINEILCGQAFPISTAQAEEIANYRAFASSLAVAGIEAPESSISVLSDISTDDETSIKDIDVLKDIFGSDSSSTSPVVSVDDSLGNRLKPESIKAMASAIFSVPSDRGMLLQSLYFLLIALIAIYLLAEIIVGSMDTSKLTKYQVWSRKATFYVLFLLVAILIAVWYRIFSIVVPLVLLTIASGAFLAWAITKRSGDQVISLPQSSQAKK